MSALTHALDDHLNHQRRNNTNGGGESTARKNGRNSSDSTSTSSPEFSPEVTLRDGNKTHGSGSAIALLRATVFCYEQPSGKRHKKEAKISAVAKRMATTTRRRRVDKDEEEEEGR